MTVELERRLLALEDQLRAQQLRLMTLQRELDRFRREQAVLGLQGVTKAAVNS